MSSAMPYSPSSSHWLDPLAVVADSLVLVVEIEPEHVGGLLGDLHRQRRRGRHPAEIVDVLGDLERVLELLRGVELELVGDVHVLGALERLRVHHVGDDRLVLAGQVFVEMLDELRARTRIWPRIPSLYAMRSGRLPGRRSPAFSTVATDRRIAGGTLRIG